MQCSPYPVWECNVELELRLSLLAGSKSSICIRLFGFKGDVGEHSDTFLHGMDLEVEAYGDGAPLALAMSLDAKRPFCKQRVLREGSVQRDTFQKHSASFTWSFGPKVPMTHFSWLPQTQLRAALKPR